MRPNDTKQQLFRIWKLNPNNLNLENKYKKCAKILDKVILDTKYEYGETQMSKNIQNPIIMGNNNKRIGKKATKKNDADYLVNNKNE